MVSHTKTHDVIQRNYDVTFIAMSLFSASCFTGTVQCHEAATCKNVSGQPTCVCNRWFTGDGVDKCYGKLTMPNFCLNLKKIGKLWK